MRLTIERLRTLILVTAVLLLMALVGFLAFGKWRNRFISHDLPQKLGLNIQQESDGVTFSHALGAHSQFKLKAARAIQLKQGDAELHDVKIEIYGEDGNRVDQIEGSQFNYNEKSGLATAIGPVKITLVRPGATAATKPDKAARLSGAARTAASGQVEITTSGLNFNYNTGLATTTERVDFNTNQGTGNAIGATYDPKAGLLALDHSLQLNSLHDGSPIQLTAAHGEFERGNMVCNLRSAVATYRAGQATAAQARVEFRENGSTSKLSATGSFTLHTQSGSTISAPRGEIEFDDHSQPHQAHLADGVTLDSARAGHHTHGTAPTAEVDFTSTGQLRHAHLEQSVALSTDDVTAGPGPHAEPLHTVRNWRSPVADVEFRPAGRGRTEPATLTGIGGVDVESRTQHGQAAPALAHMRADQIVGQFGPASALVALVGNGHASMEQTTASGAHQTATGQRIAAHFAQASGKSQNQLQSALLEQNVTFTQTAPAKPGAAPQPALRATASRAEYTGDGQWLHLLGSPRLDQGGMQLSADRIDLSQQSGDAFAHGNVKATWSPSSAQGADRKSSYGAPSLGGQDPAHAIATEAELHQSDNGNETIATFRGHARLWQQANSVTAPTITLHRQQQILEAHSTDRSEPVRVTMVSASEHGSNKSAPSQPSVLRVRGADLKYTEATRSALLSSGSFGQVTAETSAVTTQSSEVELQLAPNGARNASSGPAAQAAAPSQGQVQRLVARGRVNILSEGRHGTGEQLVYTGSTGNYELTGSATNPPRLVDPAHGTVTGQALIFRSHDDSVSIEGRGHSTTTETVAPR